MDLNTTKHILNILQAQLATEEYSKIRNILLKEYLLAEEARTEQFIADRAKVCPKGEYPVLLQAKAQMELLHRQLAAIDTLS